MTNADLAVLPSRFLPLMVSTLPLMVSTGGDCYIVYGASPPTVGNSGDCFLLLNVLILQG